MAVAPRVVAAVALKVVAVGARALVFLVETGLAQPAGRQVAVVAMLLPETRAVD